MNERGLTIQTVIISAVMALIAAVAGIVIYNIVADESEDIEEIVEEVSDITLFTEDGEEEPDEEPDEEEPDEEPDEEEPGECPEGEVVNDQGVCEIEECTATQIRNDDGECEEEEIINSGLPVKGLESGETYTCAIIGPTSLDAEDSVWCWGNNDNRQLSEAPGAISQIPVKIPGVRNIKALSVGARHACLITSDSEFSSATDTVECWGSNSSNKAGQPVAERVTPTSSFLTRPARVARVSGVKAISTGVDNTCIIASPLFSGAGDILECWGDSAFGVLGKEAADTFLGDNSGDRIVRERIEELSGKDLKAVAVGDGFACAIVGGDQPDGSADTVWCWGNNGNGQLGPNGISEGGYSIVPIEIAGLTGAKAISAGDRHICAIVGGDQPDGSADTVWCWGNNDNRQLSDSRTGDRFIPTEISDFEGAKSIAVSDTTTCIITFTDSYKCVGKWFRDGSEDGASQPKVSFIAPGNDHVCIAYADDPAVNNPPADTVWCWGNNFYGQIARAPLYIPYHIPNKIKESSGAKRVSVGANIGCFITSSDTLKCWGVNAYQQLGLPISQTENFKTVPVAISELEGVTDISNSYFGTYCVIAAKSAQISEKGVKCRGNNFNGELGVNPAFQQRSASFIDVPNVSNPVAVSNFYNHTCAISDGSDSDSFADNTIWCWGDNNSYQIIPAIKAWGIVPFYVAPGGYKWPYTANPPIPLPTFVGYRERDPSRPSVCDVTNPDNNINCYPEDTFISVTGAKAISVGRRHSCAIAAGVVFSGPNGENIATPTGEDAVWCWGHNHFGQLGLPYNNAGNPASFWPRGIPGLNGAKAISVGEDYACVITAEDTVKCWGRNNEGQLGAEPFNYPAAGRPIPLIDVPGLKRVTAISAGGRYTCAIAAVLDGANEPTSEDAVYCWGDNNFGLIGAPYTILDSPDKVSYSPTPLRIQGITAPVDISAGRYQVCAIAADLDGDNNPTGEDAVYCWGGFANGARGTLHIPGTRTLYEEVNSYPEPRQISGL